MTEALREPKISIEEYLAGEKVTEVRHEYVNGEVYAMTGARKTHNRLTKRLARIVDDLITGTPCESFTTDVKVRIRTLNDDRFYYPDLFVECEPYTDDDYYSERPILIVEVLSGSTERNDRSDKFYAYRKLDSLREYMLVAQDTPRVEVYRRKSNWDLEVYRSGQSFDLGTISGMLAVDALYADIDLDESP